MKYLVLYLFCSSAFFLRAQEINTAALKILNYETTADHPEKLKVNTGAIMDGYSAILQIHIPAKSFIWYHVSVETPDFGSAALAVDAAHAKSTFSAFNNVYMTVGRYISNEAMDVPMGIWSTKSAAKVTLTYCSYPLSFIAFKDQFSFCDRLKYLYYNNITGFNSIEGLDSANLFSNYKAELRKTDGWGAYDAVISESATRAAADSSINALETSLKSCLSNIKFTEKRQERSMPTDTTGEDSHWLKSVFLGGDKMLYEGEGKEHIMLALEYLKGKYIVYIRFGSGWFTW